eukprot:scaffold90997_cov36-Cyclotella_meneghiniana.AAC.1
MNDGTRRNNIAPGCNNKADRGHTPIQNQLNNQLGCGRAYDEYEILKEMQQSARIKGTKWVKNNNNSGTLLRPPRMKENPKTNQTHGENRIRLNGNGG